jgi:hypothetical protein
MRKITGILLLSVSFAVCLLLYLKYDDKGYNYGLDCTFCPKKMPYNLKPHGENGFSFTLNDADDFELVGIGFRYRFGSFKIKDFLAYGYNDTSVIVKCADSLNTMRYLVSYETGYKSKKGSPEISFKDLSNNDFEQVKDKYQWFEIDEEKAYEIRRMKFLFMAGALFSLFFIAAISFFSRGR